MLARPSNNVRVDGNRVAAKPTIEIADRATGSFPDKIVSSPSIDFKPGGRKRVYVPDPVHVFVPAEIVEYDDDGARVLVQVKYPTSWSSTTLISKSTAKKRPTPQAKDDNSQHWVAASDLCYQNETGSHDMQNLVHLTAATMLYNLKERHANSQPYTDCLQVLVAMNPFFRPPNLYSRAMQKHYADSLVWNRSKRKRPPPHVYQVSSAAYHALMQPSQRNQTILVSGESGAGKSETVKLILQHLAMMQHSQLESEVPACHTVQRVLESSPILEAFGNAKTLRNNNSSRFGKFTELHFDVTGDRPRLVGSKFLTYLLEKSRVIGHNPGERSYHIFYQMLSSPEELRRKVWPDPHLPTPDSFCYLASENREDWLQAKSSWEKTRVALEAFDITLEDGSLQELLRALAIVLHLGNLQISGEDEAVVGARHELEILSSFVGIDSLTFEKALTVRIMKTAFDEVTVPLRPSVARDGCDALAKEIYARIFNRLVARINSFTGRHSEKYGAISILDIFGFEKFTVNRFEQLCINYANECLQHQYISSFCVIPDELKGLGTDAFDLTQIDNSSVLDLLDGKNGLLDTLNEECITPNGSDEGYVTRIKRAHGRRKQLVDERLHRKTEFGIVHFADRVVYDATHFLDRNNDTLQDGLMECIALSKNLVLKEEFEAMLSERQAAAQEGGRKKKKKAPTTVIQKFRTQLMHLLESMEGTDTRFIRCIKPNETMTPRMTDQFNTLRQLKCAGLVAAIDVSRYRDLQVGGLFKTKSAVRIQAMFRRQRACKLVRTMRRACATVVLQAEMRRFLAVKTLLLMRKESAARRMQCFVRRALAIARVHEMRLHRSAIRIQSRVRVRRAQEIYYKRLKLRSATRLQAFIRQYRAMRVYKILRLEFSAATRIQSHVRRRKWSKFFETLKRCKAATIIQTKMRQRRALMLVFDMRSIRIAAVRIQCLVRCRRAKKTVEEIIQERASLSIQTSFRRYRAKSRVSGMRGLRAALAIQSFIRCYLTIRQIALWHDAATVVQSYARKMSATTLVMERRKARASVRIQSWLRQITAVRILERTLLEHTATMLLQRQIRMYQAKKWVENIQCHRASSLIQALARRHRARKERAAKIIQHRWVALLREQRRRSEMAATLIQAIVRKKAAGIILKRLRQYSAATIIQKQFRLVLAMKHTAACVIQGCWNVYTVKQRLRLSNAVTLIQAIARMHLTKGRLLIIRQHRAARIIQTQVRRRLTIRNEAAVIIQVHWMSYRILQRLECLRRHRAARIIQHRSRRRLALKHAAAKVIQSNWFAFYYSVASTTSVGGYSDSFPDLEEAIALLDKHLDNACPAATQLPPPQQVPQDSTTQRRLDPLDKTTTKRINRDKRSSQKKRWFVVWSCFSADAVESYVVSRGENRASF